MPSKWMHACGRLLFGATLLLSGCSRGASDGTQRAAVNGTVKLDGRPLSRGVVRFVPVEPTRGPKTSVIVSAGMFAANAADGPVVGRHRIEIESADDGGFALDDESAPKRLREAGVKRIDLVQIPAIYNTRSTLVESVAEREPNEFHFDLKTR